MGWKKIFHANRNKKISGIAILITDKIDFKTECNKIFESHYIMIMRSTQQGDTTLVNICAPNIRKPKYVRQILTNIKGEIDSNTIILGDFNTALRSVDRSSTENQ